MSLPEAALPGSDGHLLSYDVVLGGQSPDIAKTIHHCQAASALQQVSIAPLVYNIQPWHSPAR